MDLSTLRARTNRWVLLRLIGLLLSIIALLMLASLLPTAENDADYYADGMGPAYISLPFAGNCWTIIYNSIILGIVLAGTKYHPGIDIALDFFGWSLNWCMGLLLLIVAGTYDYRQYACDWSYGTDKEDCRMATKFVGIQWTGGLLTFIVG